MPTFSAQFFRQPVVNEAGRDGVEKGGGETAPELESDALYAGTYSQPMERLWPVLSIRWMAYPITYGNSLDAMGEESLCQAGSLFIGGFRDSRWQYAPPGRRNGKSCFRTGELTAMDCGTRR
ncbi:hypothetical protein SAMN05443545_1102 [Aidingimonas halophila]|uniref:Uncharacterized protein n=1 Tax=Aidingimonas halophila TaxID=574349 RepID=A0A1H3GMV1_9GAMM|nr:hypothetical protein SAMN05443545_1102 [Aidingimonas halophila]